MKVTSSIEHSSVRYGRFRDVCGASVAGDEPERLREALRFVAPSIVADVRPKVEAGAYESAALALIGPDAAWMLSKSGSGQCLATIVEPQSDSEITASGATPALALLAAWAGTMLARPAVIVPPKQRPVLH